MRAITHALCICEPRAAHPAPASEIDLIMNYLRFAKIVLTSETNLSTWADIDLINDYLQLVKIVLTSEMNLSTWAEIDLINDYLQRKNCPNFGNESEFSKTVLL